MSSTHASSEEAVACATAAAAAAVVRVVNDSSNQRDKASNEANCPESSSTVALMAINDTKAGMEGLDKERINAIIQEASKGSKFYAAKERSQKRLDQHVQKMKAKLERLTEEQVAKATKEADKEADRLLQERDLSRVIVHVDMDAYYAAVEMRDEPNLRNVPMAVGGMGMLSTSNYLARRFGVRAGMPGFIGKKLCPQLVLVPHNFDKYKAVAEEIRSVFREYDPHFVPMSLDEAYLDLTDYLSSRCPRVSAEEAVEELRAKIEEKTRLTASAGIAPNARLAKVCSDMNKPNGQFCLPPDVKEIENFVRALPIRKVSGVGNVTAQQLDAVGVITCGDLWERRGLLRLLLSETSSGFFLRVALGLGSTNLTDWSDRERQSISTESTFKDTSDQGELAKICGELSVELSERLEAKDMRGRGLTLKIKTDKFQIKSKISNLLNYTNDAAVIESAARGLLRHFSEAADEKPLRLRLMGIRMSDFDDGESSEGASGGRQRTLADLIKRKESGFECPICGRRVAVTTEGAFNTHLDRCLAKEDRAVVRSEVSGVHGEAVSSSRNAAIGSRERPIPLEAAVCEKVQCPMCSRALSVSGESADVIVSRHMDAGCDSEPTMMPTKRKAVPPATGGGKPTKKKNITNYFIRKQ